jgi:hypothetical protein
MLIASLIRVHKQTSTTARHRALAALHWTIKNELQKAAPHLPIHDDQ